mgnify:CR=1 FL=1
MKFRAAQKNRIFQDVVNQIQDAILQGDLNPGDLLPSERELKEMFSTSRGTLREALRVLEQKGLIEIRLGAGGGAVVRDTPAAPVSEGLDLLIRMEKISLAHLAEFREGVEGTVAALAAERATPADIEHLDGLLRAAREATEAGPGRWAAFQEIDQRTHQTIARIAGNPLYNLIHQMVHDNIHRYYERLLSIDDGRMAENYRDLERIITAIRDRDPDAARRSAQHHVRRFGEYMRRSLAGSGDDGNTGPHPAGPTGLDHRLGQSGSPASPNPSPRPPPLKERG